MYLRYLTAKWQAQIASNPRTSFLSMWCRLNLEFPFHDSTPRVRDLPWSTILKKIRDCAERSEVRESRTVKLEPARALDPRRWPRGSQLWERECSSNSWSLMRNVDIPLFNPCAIQIMFVMLRYFVAVANWNSLDQFIGPIFCIGYT